MVSVAQKQMRPNTTFLAGFKFGFCFVSTDKLTKLMQKVLVCVEEETSDKTVDDAGGCEEKTL